MTGYVHNTASLPGARPNCTVGLAKSPDRVIHPDCLLGLGGPDEMSDAYMDSVCACIRVCVCYTVCAYEGSGRGIIAGAPSDRRGASGQI